MNVQELGQVIRAVMSEMPTPITEMLGDVDLLLVDTPDEAFKQVQADFDDVDPLPADCKGMFIGEILESEADDDDPESEEVVYPDGVIVMCAANLPTPEDAAIVLMHEVGHALGMDEDEVSALGLGIGEAVPKPDLPATPPTEQPDDGKNQN